MNNRTDKPAAFHDASQIQGSKALELIMRDVLDGMQEFATLANFSPRARGGYEIIAIEADADLDQAKPAQSRPAPTRAEVIELKKRRSHTG